MSRQEEGVAAQGNRSAAGQGCHRWAATPAAPCRRGATSVGARCQGGKGAHLKRLTCQSAERGPPEAAPHVELALPVGEHRGGGHHQHRPAYVVVWCKLVVVNGRLRPIRLGGIAAGRGRLDALQRLQRRRWGWGWGWVAWWWW